MEGTSERKLKMLFFGDSPVTTTGFARVSREVLKRLHDTGKYEITILAINHNVPYYDQQKFPYKIIPANYADPNDVFGVNILPAIIENEKPDIIFTINDQDVVLRHRKVLQYAKDAYGTKLVSYFPVDTDFYTQLTETFLKLVDYPVYYTKFSKTLARKNLGKLAETGTVIYHGTDVDVFKKLEDQKRVQEFKQKAFGLDKDGILVTYIGRNQWRKDMYRAMLGFLLFNKEYPNSKLYLHAKVHDMGGYLEQQAGMTAIQMGMKPEDVLGNKIIFTPQNYHELVGVGEDKLQLIYNASDIILSTTQGEGWGLVTTEAMASERPIAITRNTAQVEIIGENEERGYFIKNGETLNDWTIPYGFSQIPRPLADVYHVAEVLKRIVENPKEAQQKVKNAREWVESYTWDKVGDQWKNLFDTIEEDIRKEQNGTIKNHNKKRNIARLRK